MISSNCNCCRHKNVCKKIKEYKVFNESIESKKLDDKENSFFVKTICKDFDLALVIEGRML